MTANRYPMPGLVKPHKAMAGATGEQNFGIPPVPGGVPSVNHMDSPVHGPGISHAPMPDHKRAAPIPRGGKHLHNQRHPDHGPHHSSPMHPAGSGNP